MDTYLNVIQPDEIISEFDKTLKKAFIRKMNLYLFVISLDKKCGMIVHF